MTPPILLNMKYLVGAEPVEIPRAGRARPVIQNLGPGKVYLDTDTTVTADTGLLLDVGDTYEFSSPGANEDGIFVVADLAGTDVRVVLMGDN